jgi:hypothetical protein
MSAPRAPGFKTLAASKSKRGFAEMRSNHRIKLRDKFTGWRCDSCGDVITSVQAGWVDWLASEDKHGKDVLSGIRLVHRGPRQKARKHNCRYDPLKEFRSRKTIVEGLPLNRLVGADGLMVLLSLLAEGELPHTEILELVKRVQIPGYELVRSLSRTWERSKLLAPVLGHGCYLQSEIQEVLARATGRQFDSRSKLERKASVVLVADWLDRLRALNWTLYSFLDSSHS